MKEKSLSGLWAINSSLDSFIAIFEYFSTSAIQFEWKTCLSLCMMYYTVYSRFEVIKDFFLWWENMKEILFAKIYGQASMKSRLKNNGTGISSKCSPFDHITSQEGTTQRKWFYHQFNVQWPGQSISLKWTWKKWIISFMK